MTDLKEFLGAAQKRVVREAFGEGSSAFEVELQMCSRSDLERMRKSAVIRVLDRKTRQYRDEPDLAKLREYLRDHCITGWNGFTFSKAAAVCNRSLPAGQMAEWATKAVPFNAGNAQMLLEEAIGFEDWVWERVTQLAEDRENDEAGESPS